MNLDSQLPEAGVRRIAEAYRTSRWNRHYVRAKLATDPLYAGVGRALGKDRAPVLDLGCGIGLLAQCLAANTPPVSYLGVDNDAGKIRHARLAAARAGLEFANFRVLDLAAGHAIAELGHRGDVVLLDLLQFVPPDAHGRILEQAAAAVAPGCRLVMRSGLAGRNWRVRVTRAVDVLSRAVRWMNAGPRVYPERVWLEHLLVGHGLEPEFSSLWGRTPFNNWLITARRPAE